MSLLAARTVAATAAGGISSGARVIAAVVVVGHVLILSMLGGEVGSHAAKVEGFEILYSSNDDQGQRCSISMP